MAQTTALIDALKRVLREQGITYADVAQRLELSLPSVKRLFADRQFTVQRLDQVCELAGIEITDLVRRMQADKEIHQLEWEQEQELVSDPKLLIVAVSALNRWSFRDILATYIIKEPELIQRLARLDRMKLIELMPGNRIRPLASTDFQWHKGGPIQRFFEAQVQNDFFRCTFEKPGELRLFVTGMLSRESNGQLQQKMQRLAQDFRSLHQEDQALPLADRFGTSLVLAMRPWELEIFRQHRRADTDKPF